MSRLTLSQAIELGRLDEFEVGKAHSNLSAGLFRRIILHGSLYVKYISAGIPSPGLFL